MTNIQALNKKVDEIHPVGNDSKEEFTTGDVKSILEEYQKSDFEKRLYLFLGHRSLRKKFADIDQSTPLIQREGWFDLRSLF